MTRYHDEAPTGTGRALALATGAALLALVLAPGRAEAQGDVCGADAAAAAATEPAGESDESAGSAPASGGETAGAAPSGSGQLRTTQMCIDKAIADRLAVKRQRRGAIDRLFVKQQRHEFSAMGGYYSSDLFSGTYVTGGAYTFHLTEDTAVEFSAAYTHANADIIRAIEDGRGDIIDDDYARVLLVESLLMWSPVYGKLRLGGAIMRFDLHVDLGVGVVDSQTSRGAAGVAGVGMKLFLGKAMALRIDARDHVFRQELLDERFLVNDVAVTAGLSIFLPFSN